MAPRLFWFLAGGASALWFVKHHERKHEQWEQWANGDQQQGGWGGWKREPNCMKYSWYHGNHHRQNSQTQQAIADQEQARADLDDVAEAKERLMTSIKTGIRNVMDTLVSIEATFNEERADLQRRRQEAATRASAAHSEPTTAPPQTASTIEKSAIPVPPHYSPPSAEANDAVTMSQILSALENINSKLGNVNPSTGPKET